MKTERNAHQIVAYLTQRAQRPASMPHEWIGLADLRAALQWGSDDGYALSLSMAVRDLVSLGVLETRGGWETRFEVRLVAGKGGV